MITVKLEDDHMSENMKALQELRRTGMFSDEELQEMYDKQIEEDKQERRKGYE